MSVTVILGDAHIGGSISMGKTALGSNLNSRIIDQIYLLDWTLQQCIDNNATTLIMTGDVFDDPKPHPAIISQLIMFLKRCEDNNISVHIPVGNHDILRSGQYNTSALDIVNQVDMNNIHVYNEITTLHSNNVSFTLVPFKDRKALNVDSNKQAIEILKEKIQYNLFEIPSTFKKVLIGHLAIEGAIPVGNEIDDMTNELHCPFDLFEGYDYVWMGHVHKPQVMCRKPYIAHIGSMDISDFSETDHKKHIVIFDSDLEMPFRHVILPTRQLSKITISVPEDTKDTTEFVLKSIKELKLQNALVKVDINLESPNLISVKKNLIEDALYKAGAFNITRFSETKKIINIKQKTSSIDSSINTGAAIKLYAEQFVDEKCKSDFIDLANDIVNLFNSEAKE
jgi:exonuclease SbcD